MYRNEKHKNKLVCTYKLTPCTEKQVTKEIAIYYLQEVLLFHS